MRNCLLRRFGRALLLLVVAALVVSGCGNSSAGGLRPDVRILFQHDWAGRDAAVLAQLLDNFSLVRPDLHIIAEPIAPSALEASFTARFAEGLEADVVLADGFAAQNLMRKGLVQELSQYGVQLENFDPAALRMVGDGQRFYGVPLALTTQLLFFNRALIAQAPTTIAELEAVTSQPGVVMGLNTSFEAAFWGLAAFGGRAYDDEGRLMVDPGALVNWLTALTNIQGAAGFVLSDHQDHLRTQFLAGETALYVADAVEVDLLAEKLGEQLGIATLPTGANGSPAGPLLEASILLISANADEEQVRQALALIEFLTNSQQQSLLTLSDTGRLAAVNTVYVSPSMPDVVVQLATQLGSAVPITLAQRDAWDKLAASGQPVYRSVLEGVTDEQAAAADLLRDVQAVEGVPDQDPAETCPTVAAGAPLTIAVWHAWSEAETRVLRDLAAEFENHCPSFAISLAAIGNSTTLNTRFREAVEAGTGPDVLIGSTEWMAQLAEDGLIRPLSDEIKPDELSAFVPSAVNAVFYAGKLYAYPESVDSLALFYNPTLMPSPAKTLHELMLQVDSTHRFAMPLDFFYAYWGLAAFGSRMLAADGATGISGSAGQREGTIEADAGAEAWLRWLHEAARRPGFAFTVGRAEAEQLFIKREAAYLVSGPWSLARLRAVLPPEEIAVALLPSGPRNRAAPLLEVEGFMFNRSAAPAAFAGGLAFARFVASRHSAEALAATGLQVPANVTVDLHDVPVLDGLIDQAQLAEGVVQDNTWKEIARLGNVLYRRVVAEDTNPEKALADFVQAANQVMATGGEE